MQRLRRAILALLVVWLAQPSAFAQEPQAVKQIVLTEKQVVSFIAARNEIAPIIEKMQRSQADKPPLPQVLAEFESIARKHGFASLAEHEDVRANVWIVMAGIDPVTKAFTEPQDALKKEIAEVEADKSIPAPEKKQILEELNEALHAAQPLRYKGNLELVKKHYEKLEVAMQ